VAETLDEHTFQAMTDGEFYALLALIRQACEREARRERVIHRWIRLGDSLLIHTAERLILMRLGAGRKLQRL